MNHLLKPFLTATVALFAVLLLTQCGDSGEDHMESEGATASTDSTGNAYPRDKVQDADEVNLSAEDGEYDLPMDLGGAVSRIEKRKMLALLMRQKTDLMYRIEELEALPGDASDNTVVEGDIDKMRTYISKLDAEIVGVRKADEGSMKAAAASALAAVKGAGALMQSSVIRIDQGF